MAGLVEEGKGLRLMSAEPASRSISYYEKALSRYQAAADLAYQNDWQPRFRKGIILVFLNQAEQALAEFHSLIQDFEGIEVYITLMRMCTLCVSVCKIEGEREKKGGNIETIIRHWEKKCARLHCPHCHMQIIMD